MQPTTDARKRMPLHAKMAIGFAAGLALGLVAHYASGADAGWVKWLTTWITQPVGTIFLRLIFMLVIPLLFSALIMGVAEMGDVRSLGRVGWKTLGYTVVASGIAVVLGLALVNWLHPGGGGGDRACPRSERTFTRSRLWNSAPRKRPSAFGWSSANDANDASG